MLLVEFAEFARMKSVLKALKLGKTDKMHPFNIRKEDKCNLSVFALWRQAKRKLFAGL